MDDPRRALDGFQRAALVVPAKYATAHVGATARAAGVDHVPQSERQARAAYPDRAVDDDVAAGGATAVVGPEVGGGDPRRDVDGAGQAADGKLLRLARIEQQ